MGNKFSELKPYYTEKDLIEARKKNQLYFFDVVYFSGFGIEHNGYSNYYGNINDLIEATYMFLKKNSIEMIAGDKSVHLRSVDRIIPDYGDNGNGNIFGYMSIMHKPGEDDRIKIFLNKKLDFSLDEFMKIHDDVVIPEETNNNIQKIMKK